MRICPQDVVPDTPEGARKMLLSLHVGQELCDCRFEHHKVKEFEWEYSHAPGEEGLVYDAVVVFENGFTCSLLRCCDPADHEYSHEQEGAT